MEKARQSHLKKAGVWHSGGSKAGVETPQETSREAQLLATAEGGGATHRLVYFEPLISVAPTHLAGPRLEVVLEHSSRQHSNPFQHLGSYSHKQFK